MHLEEFYIKISQFLKNYFFIIPLRKVKTLFYGNSQKLKWQETPGNKGKSAKRTSAKISEEFPTEIPFYNDNLICFKQWTKQNATKIYQTILEHDWLVFIHPYNISSWSFIK